MIIKQIKLVHNKTGKESIFEMTIEQYNQLLNKNIEKNKPFSIKIIKERNL